MGFPIFVLITAVALGASPSPRAEVGDALRVEVSDALRAGVDDGPRVEVTDAPWSGVADAPADEVSDAPRAEVQDVRSGGDGATRSEAPDAGVEGVEGVDPAAASRSVAGENDGGVTTPISLKWAPLVVPAALVIPGTGHALREEDALASRIRWSAVGLFGAAALGAIGIAASGAAESVTAPVVPIMLVGVGGFLSLGVSDAVAAFTSPESLRLADTSDDIWNASGRLRLGYGYAPNVRFRQDHFLLIGGETRQGRFLVAAEGAGATTLGDFFLGGALGVTVLPLTSVRDGLSFELSTRQEWNRDGGFDNTRFRARALFTLPMEHVSPWMRPVNAQFRLGVQEIVTSYRGTDRHTAEFLYTGGFELRWTASKRLRPYLSYEHARDGITGGTGTGFLGVFSLGIEGEVGRGFFADLRGDFGTAPTIGLQLERRFQ